LLYAVARDRMRAGATIRRSQILSRDGTRSDEREKPEL
jgi:hypothetical protein